MSKGYVEWIRARVGRRKIFLVTSSVVLQDEGGLILLQHRSDFDAWGLPGGVMEIGEDIQACARRELWEETGLQAGLLKLVGVYTHPQYDVQYPNGDQVQQYTICLTSRLSGGEMRPDGVESRAQAFFAPHELADLPIPIWYRAMIADVQRGGEPAFLPPYTNGHPIDQIQLMRQYVGQERFIGVGATVLVQGENGRFLMIQRQDNGHWSLPGGFSDLGENVAHTAVRETLEETGYSITPQRILGVYSSPAYHDTYPNGDQMKMVGVLFLAQPAGLPGRPDGREVNATAWRTAAEMLATITPLFRPLARQALDCLPGGYFLD
jgi:ADP-ribose pyrophosphatase YjhB (NUDIX family)